MAITRSQIARQLLAEGGVSLDDAKMMAPKGEFLAYINPKEAQMLKDAGGSGIMTPMGIPSFVEYGGAEATAGASASQDQVDSFSGGDSDPIQDQIQSRLAPKTPVRDMVTSGLDTIARFTVPGYNRIRSAMNISNLISRNIQPKVTNIVDEVALTGGRTAPTIPEGDSDTQIVQPVMPMMPLVPKLPTDIEPEKSDMAELEEFKQRFNLPEQFRLAKGGEVRQEYGLGKLVKKITKPIKKIVKSDVGKAALLAAAAYYAPGVGIKAAGGFKPFLVGAPTTASRAAFSGILGTGGQFAPSVGKLATSIFGPQGLTKFSGTQKALAGIAGASILGGLAAGGEEEDIDSLAGRIADETGIDVAQIRKEVQDAYASGDISGLQSKYPFLIPTSAAQSGSFADGGIARLGYANGETVLDISDVNLDSKMKAAQKLSKETGMPIEKALEKIMADAFAEGVSIKRIKEEMVMPKRKPPKEVQKRKEKNFKKAKPALEKESADMVEDLIRSKKAGGGLMDLGGNEMDLRGGGFVPIGAKEKADDVPARLSKNEFVFTADAVRAAGGGSVEKGAQKMYNTMKQLEDSIA